MMHPVDQPATLERAFESLQSSRPVVLPTDTVYGLAALATDAAAVDALFALKDRPAERSIAVLVADEEQAATLAHITPPEHWLMEAFWPGALTLVVHRRDDVTAVGADDGTVGIRCPAEPFARRLAALAGPLATTSANRSGQPTPSTASEAAASLSGPVDVIVDGGARSGDASTVARATPHGVEVLRPGPITAAELQAVLESYH